MTECLFCGRGGFFGRLCMKYKHGIYSMHLDHASHIEGLVYQKLTVAIVMREHIEAYNSFALTQKLD